MAPNEINIVRSLAERYIKERVPEEAGIFEEIADEYFTDPKSFEQSEASDNALGFGVGDFISMTTPAVISMMTVIVSKLGEPVIKGLIEGSTGAISDITVKVFERYFEKDSENEKQEKIKQLIEVAKTYGIPRAKRLEFVEKMMK